MPGCRRRSNCRSTASTPSCFEKGALGEGASTRNGGAVSGGVNIGKSFQRQGGRSRSRARRLMLSDGYDAFALVERLIEEEAIGCFLAEARAFSGRLDAKTLRVSSQPSRPPQRQRPIGRLYGAARAPARRDRQRLLLRRHGRRALGQPSSGALLQGAARCLPAPRHRVCAEAAVEGISAERCGLAGRDQPRRRRGRRCGNRHQRLYRHADPALAAPRRAGRQPYHRHRRIAGRSRPLAGPEGPHLVRHQARALLLPDVARREADGVRRPCPVHPGRSAAQRPGAPRLHDRAVSRSCAGVPASPMAGPATPRSRSTRCRIWAKTKVSITRSAATAAALR
jgi:hypothetical protein